MIKYNIFVTPEAYDDINNIYDFIYYNYHAPITAKRYIEGLYKKLKSLSSCAGSFKTETRLSIVNRYGLNIRRINYKKCAALYLVHDTEVYILRVLNSSTISGIF
ncbi:MAG: type II toxin-antitoxin system RelE/ParE family toxin [Paludibacteraceae bacterium]|nr:type II toxin-antitoxin system RelE/ParE family toxin [Paludibacteraceae bacterium]